MTIANIDSSIAFKSSSEIGFPLSRFLSSLKVKTPFYFKVAYRWSVKLLRVSSALKLRKTSYFHLQLDEEEEEEEEEEDWLYESMKANLSLQVNLASQYRIIDTRQDFIQLDLK